MSLLDFIREDPTCQHLAEGAMWAVLPLAEDSDPGPVLQVLEDWAFELAGHMPLPWNMHEAIDALNAYLFQKQCLGGDRDTFDDPDNAVLSRVLQRRKGLPISLCILWMDMAQRMGFHSVGIALPGHFVVGLRLDIGTLYFDPFNGGQAIGEEDMGRLVHRSTSGRVRFDIDMLEPASHRAILARLVRNLHLHFMRKENWTEALWTSTHLMLLSPSESLAYRDRALVHVKRGDLPAAAEDLQKAIELSDEEDPQQIAWLERLRRAGS